MTRDEMFKQYMHIIPTQVNKLLKNPTPQLATRRDDIIQEGYIALLNLIDKKYELHTATFKTYATTALRRELVRIIQREKSKLAEMVGWEEDIADVAPDTHKLNSEQVQALRDIIARYDKDTRLAYQLYFLGGMTIKDTARILKKRYVTVVKILGGIYEDIGDELRN